MPARRILLIAQLAPPSPLSAARRVAGLARHLARRGHEVTVLTSVLSGRGPIEGAAHVVRTRDLLASDINWRRENFARLEGGDGNVDYAPSRLASVLAPDPALVSWLPFAVPRARRLARRADCAITTAPARSTHLIGLALRRTPWVADFRDGWRFEDQRPAWAHPALDRLDAAMERAVVRAADACMGVTEPIAADLRDRLGATQVATVTNGFDDEDPDLAGALPEGVADDGFRLVVHTGSLAYGGRDPRPLIDAVRLLRREDPDLAERLRVLFAGPVSADERSVIEAADLDGRVRALGALPRPAALALQRKAAALLLITGEQQVGVATGKLYEYLAARRPILVLGERSEAARLVREAGAGIATSARDPEAIAAALRAILARPAAPVPPAQLARYSYAHIAEQVAEVVERAISSHAAR